MDYLKWGGVVVALSGSLINTANAQFWNGTVNTTSNIYRQGNVGIGYTTAPTWCSPLEVNGDFNMNQPNSALRINCTPVLHVTGANNLFVGDNAGQFTTGTLNTFVGYSSGINNGTGSFNTFLGERSGVNNLTGSSNLFLGSSVGFSNTTGSSNIFMGLESGYSNTTGGSNLYIGNKSGYTLSTTSNNIFLGHNSGELTTSSANSILLGNNAGYFLGTSSDDIYIGQSAGYALFGPTGSSSSILIGNETGYNYGGGANNIAIGYRSGYTMFPTATENTMVGSETGQSLTDGFGNVLFGKTAGVSITSGDLNTLIGTSTSCGATDNRNTAVGQGASISTGFSNSSAFGTNSNACAANTIVLGSNNGVQGNEVIMIGRCSSVNAVAGELEIAGTGGGILGIWADGVFTPSDKKLKKNIEPIGGALAILDNINGYKYYFKDSIETGVRRPGGEHVGVLAQELVEHYPYGVKRGKSGYYGVDYRNLIPLLIAGINEQQSKIDKLERMVGKSEENSLGTNPAGTISQNSPNPFSSSTTIDYEIYGEFEYAEIQVYNMSGELQFEKALLENESTVLIDGQFLEPGIFAYTLVVDGVSVETKTMVVAK